MGISLSGYLPGADDDGLSRLGEGLVAMWERAKKRHQDAGAATEVVVVGVLRGVSLKEFRNSEEKPPTIELRFARIEAMTGPEADQALAMLMRLADTRRAVQPLPGVDDDPTLPDINNVREAERPKRPRPPHPRPVDDDPEAGQ